MGPKNYAEVAEQIGHSLFAFFKGGGGKKTHGSLFKGARLASAAAAGSKLSQFRAGSAGMWKSAYNNSFAGFMYLGLPMALYTASSAPRGHFLSKGFGSAGGLIGSAVGGLIGGIPGAIVGGALGDQVSEKFIGDTYQSFSELNRNITALNMGGNYRDTQKSFTMRQNAVREMSGSLMNARSVLGKEAAYMHA